MQHIFCNIYIESHIHIICARTREREQRRIDESERFDVWFIIGTGSYEMLRFAQFSTSIMQSSELFAPIAACNVIVSGENFISIAARYPRPMRLRISSLQRNITHKERRSIYSHIRYIYVLHGCRNGSPSLRPPSSPSRSLALNISRRFQCRATLTNMSFMNERSLIAPRTAYCTGGFSLFRFVFFASHFSCFSWIPSVSQVLTQSQSRNDCERRV